MCVKYGEFPSLLSYHRLLVTTTRFPLFFPFKQCPYHNFLCSGSLTTVHSHLALSTYGLLLTSHFIFASESKGSLFIDSHWTLGKYFVSTYPTSIHRLPLDSSRLNWYQSRPGRLSNSLRLTIWTRLAEVHVSRASSHALQRLFGLLQHRKVRRRVPDHPHGMHRPGHAGHLQSRRLLDLDDELISMALIAALPQEYAAFRSSLPPPRAAGPRYTAGGL